MSGMSARSDSSGRPCQLARRLADAPNARSWGRLYFAVLAVDSRSSSDQSLFGSLLPQAWNAGGYHLRLEALEAAECFGSSNEPYRSEILNFVKSLDPNHSALVGTRIDVLARFGEIESAMTVENIQADIRRAISQPEDINHCWMAHYIVSLWPEDEAIFGPYYEAIDGLANHEKVLLFTMAIRSSDPSLGSFHLSWTLERLIELVPTGNSALDDAAKSVFATYLGGPPEGAVMPQYAIRACLSAIRGWAKFESALPRATSDPTPEHRNWRLVAYLLLSHERDDVEIDTEDTWRALLRDARQTLLTMESLESAARIQEPPHALGRLIENHPEPLRRLFEWALGPPAAEIPADRLRERTRHSPLCHSNARECR